MAKFLSSENFTYTKKPIYRIYTNKTHDLISAKNSRSRTVHNVSVTTFTRKSRERVDNPGYRSESEMGAARVNDGYAEIGQTSRNQVHRHGRVITAGGLNSRTVPYLHPQMSESSASVGQVPSPYLIPQPSYGKDNQIINLRERYEMQTINQTTNERIATCYTNTVGHVVPTDPQTGYSTLQ